MNKSHLGDQKTNLYPLLKIRSNYFIEKEKEEDLILTKTLYLQLLYLSFYKNKNSSLKLCTEGALQSLEM